MSFRYSLSTLLTSLSLIFYSCQVLSSETLTADQQFESLLEKILGRILGEYIEGITKDQMKVGIWSGKVDIRNLKIKPSVINQLNIPFSLNFGMIE